MSALDPSYIRSIRDGIINGNIKANNQEALPDGLVGLYDKELFPPTMKWKERKETLHFFLVFALAQKEISADFASAILGDGWYNLQNEKDSEQDKRLQKVNDLIQMHSKRLSSASGGKYRLYHERFRVYILQKVSDEQITIYNESYIFNCQVALQINYREIEEYALQFLSFHILSRSLIQNDSKSFFEYYENYNLIDRQKKLTKSYSLAKKDLEIKLKYSFYSKLKQTGYKASIELLSIHHKEQQSIEDFLLLINESDNEVFLQWLENFKGSRQLKVIFLIFHELLIKYPYKYSIETKIKNVNELINVFIVNEDENGIKWTDYFSIQLLFKVQVELTKLGVENYKLWRHEFDVSEILPYCTNNLDLILRLLNESNSDNYYRNIEKLLKQEDNLNEFYRIEKIILSIEKDGKLSYRNSFGSYQSKDIDKYLFQVNCLNNVIRSNNSLSNNAFELQKKIIESLPASSLKLKIIYKLIQESNFKNRTQIVENFYTSILDSLDYIINPNHLYLILNLYPFVIQNENISNKAIETLKHVLKAKKNSENTVIEIAQLIEILKLKNYKEILYWTERKDNIIIEIESNNKSKRFNPFLPKIFYKKPEDYRNVLLSSALESKDKELIINIINQLYIRKEYNQSNFEILIKCYKYLIDNNLHEATVEIELWLRELFNESKILPNQIFSLLLLHNEYQNIEQSNHWLNKINLLIDVKEGNEKFDLYLHLIQLGFTEYIKHIIEFIDSIKDPRQRIKYYFYILESKINVLNFEDLIIEIDFFLNTFNNIEKFDEIIRLLNKTANPFVQFHILEHLSKHLLVVDTNPNAAHLFSNIEKLNNGTLVPDELNYYFKKLLNDDNSIVLDVDFVKFINKFFSHLNPSQLVIWEDFDNKYNRLITLFVKVSFLNCFGRKEQISDLISLILEHDNQGNHEFIPKTYYNEIQELLN